MYIVPFTTSGGASNPLVVAVEKVNARANFETFAGVIWLSAEKRVEAKFFPGIVQLPSSAGAAAAGGSACGAFEGTAATSFGGGEAGPDLLQPVSAAQAASAALTLNHALLTRRITPP
jgi:hypothetical protein